MHLLHGDLGRLEVDRLDLDQREVPLALLGRPDLSRHRVAGVQVEPPDLGRRDVDVVRTGKIVVLRRSEETEALRKNLEHAFAEDQALAFGLALENPEDQILAPHPGWVFDRERLGDAAQLVDGHLLELGEVETTLLSGSGRRGALPLLDLVVEVERDHDRVFVVGLLLASHVGFSVSRIATRRPARRCARAVPFVPHRW